MATRKNLTHPERVRARIQTSQLTNRLTNHVLGKVKLTNTQVTAALGLLRKTLPDLSAVEHSGEIVNRNANELSDSELADIAASSRPGVVEAPRSTH